MNKKSGNFYSC